ncbi:MAG: DNA double-strand break repair nuclease NurA [Candidatus Nezhaarchaeales archaeon]
MGFVFCGRFCRGLAVIEDYVDSLRDLDGLVVNSGFIDGGYDSSIRLSRSVLVLTGCGLGIVDGRYGGFYGVLSDRPLIHASNYYVFEDTPLLIMQTLEFMVAYEVLRSLDVDLLFMDGAYHISAMYTRTSRYYRNVLYSEDLDELIRDVLCPRFNERGPSELPMSEVDDVVERWCSECGFDELGDEPYPIAYHVAWDKIRLHMLSRLLKAARERNVGVFWLAKEYHSSVLSRHIGSQWISDLALLTEGLSMSSAIYVPVHRVVGRDEGFKLHDLAEDFPEEYALWDLIYFKVHKYSPVLCLTYPSAHRDLLECALGTLYTLSHGKGYPEPMIIVHSKSTVSRGIAGLIADKLYEKSGDVSLAKTARDAMGLR